MVQAAGQRAMLFSTSLRTWDWEVLAPAGRCHHPGAVLWSVVGRPSSLSTFLSVQGIILVHHLSFGRSRNRVPSFQAIGASVYVEEIWEDRVNMPDVKSVTVGACSGKACTGREGTGQASCRRFCLKGYAAQQRWR